jgi:hypothetical protein
MQKPPFVLSQSALLCDCFTSKKCHQATVAQPRHCVHTWDSLDLLLEIHHADGIPLK